MVEVREHFVLDVAGTAELVTFGLNLAIICVLSMGLLGFLLDKFIKIMMGRV